MSFPSRAEVETLRRYYPIGTRVELMEMNDPQAPPIGTLGTGVPRIAVHRMRADPSAGTDRQTRQIALRRPVKETE